MFENPFTPESKKAKKSLFAKKLTAKILKLSNKTERSISELENKLVSFGDYEIMQRQLYYIHLIREKLKRGEKKSDNLDYKNKELDKIILKQFEESLNYIGRWLDDLALIFNKLEDPIDENGNVIVLNLHRNPLYVLPPGISKLTKLKALIIDSAEIFSLPEELKKLKSLKYIFWDNKAPKYNRDQAKKMLPKVKFYFNAIDF